MMSPRDSIEAMGVKVCVKPGLEQACWFPDGNTLVVPPGLSADEWEIAFLEVLWEASA